MRILFLGDVVGRAGRDAVTTGLPDLKTRTRADVVIVNGENAARGFGLTDKICAELYEAGADAITTGNHVWDQRELIGYIDGDARLVRPLNFPRGTPGRGFTVLETKGRGRILVVNVMTRLFMDPLDDPFAALDGLLAQFPLGGAVQAVFVDVHGEASSEKAAIAYHLDGRVSAAIGTHTHVPTADARVLPKGTAFQTDAGMCGCYDSIIGMKVEPAVQRFVRKMPGERLTPAEGEGTLCGALVETDPATGLATTISPFRLGGFLQPQDVPETPA